MTAPYSHRSSAMAERQPLDTAPEGDDLRNAFNLQKWAQDVHNALAPARDTLADSDGDEAA